MRYQLNLNSENYYSTETPTYAGHRVYAVDWTFLPADKKFKMSFTIETLRRTPSAYTAGNNTVKVRCSFSGVLDQNVIGGATTNKQNTNFIGCLVIKRVSNSANDLQVRTFPHHNPPTYLSSRPTGNFLTIDFENLSTIRPPSSITSYLMTLFFEEVE